MNQFICAVTSAVKCGYQLQRSVSWCWNWDFLPSPLFSEGVEVLWSAVGHVVWTPSFPGRMGIPACNHSANSEVYLFKCWKKGEQAGNQIFVSLGQAVGSAEWLWGMLLFPLTPTYFLFFSLYHGRAVLVYAVKISALIYSCSSWDIWRVFCRGDESSGSRIWWCSWHVGLGQELCSLLLSSEYF